MVKDNRLSHSQVKAMPKKELHAQILLHCLNSYIDATRLSIDVDLSLSAPGFGRKRNF